MKRMLAAAFGLMAVASVTTAEAQVQGRKYRLAVISPSMSSAEEIRKAVFPELARRGFAEGGNLTVTMHVGAFAELPALGAAAVATKPDVVIAVSNAGVNAILAASKTVPVVMAFAGEDPVAAGIARSLSHPGGSVTGLTNQTTELDGKRLSLLIEAAPGARKIAILAIPPPRHMASVAEMQKVALRFGVQTEVFLASNPAEYAAAFAAMRAAGAEALAIAGAPEFVGDAAVIARLAIAGGLPSIGEASSMARDGILIGYGPDRIVFRRRAAEFVVRILRGAQPGDLPIERPTTFEFAVNRNTAAALGLAVPPLILAQADEVIE